MNKRSEVVAFDIYPGDGDPIDKYPVILTKAEFDAVMRRGRTLCLHKWVYRKGRDVGGLRVIVTDSAIKDSNIPAGRYCERCGKIEWCRAKEESPPWSQLDFTPKR